MMSVVLLNWARPGQVKQILSHLVHSDVVGEVIVWNNRVSCSSDQFMVEHPDVKLIESSCDMSLFTRFSAAALAKHEAVLYHDDDILLPNNTLEQLYAKWEAEPQRLHGLVGRRPREDNTYSRKVLGGTAPMVLTTVMLAHRKYASAALGYRDVPEVSEVLAEGRPYGNGEDIVISYAAMRQSGQKHRLWRFEKQRLPSKHAICNRWRGHYRYRTRIMRAMQAATA